METRRAFVRDLEHEHQVALFAWAKRAQRTMPELRWLHSTLNGMPARSARSANRQAAAGNRKGVPDVFLDVARGGYHGLRIELKRPGPHSTSREQREWIAGYNARGYKAAVCVGWDAARELIVEYLGGGK